MSLPLEDALRQCDRHAQNRAQTLSLQLIGWLARLKLEFEQRKAT
jgi:hypothetical protein